MLRQVVAVAAGLLLWPAGTAGERERFVTTGGSQFLHIDGTRWVETRSKDVDSSFTEVKRTKDLVELYDRDRDMRVRLYSDRGEWHNRDLGAWVRWPKSDGAWKSR